MTDDKERRRLSDELDEALQTLREEIEELRRIQEQWEEQIH